MRVRRDARGREFCEAVYYRRYYPMTSSNWTKAADTLERLFRYDQGRRAESPLEMDVWIRTVDAL
jgi:hypothetical protein